MSSVYNLLPATSGKVVMHTTNGDLEIELWPKQAPLACRNFVQLCLEGYYDNTIFHRIVAGFIVQGGDPSGKFLCLIQGTGLGGESIYGKPFADEFHSRLKFLHRGMLAMASTGANQNTSQFFFTLDKQESLNFKNTIFGKIVGDTIFNLLKIGESEVDEDERPLYPTRIVSVDVLSNPFDDIIPRITPEERKAAFEEDKKRREEEEKAKRPKGTKYCFLILHLLRDKKLLSFADQGFEDEEQADDTFVVKKEKLSAASLRKKQENDESEGIEKQKKKTIKSEAKDQSEEEDEEAFKPHHPSTKPVANINDEILKMKKEIISLNSKPIAIQKQEKVSIVDAYRQEYLGKQLQKRKRKGGDEDETLKKLQSFRQKIVSSSSSAQKTNKKKGGMAECRLHGLVECHSCTKEGRQEEEEIGDDWLGNKLVFKRDANVYEPKVDDYVMIDPRTEAQLDKVKVVGPKAVRDLRESKRVHK